MATRGSQRHRLSRVHDVVVVTVTRERDMTEEVAIRGERGRRDELAVRDATADLGGVVGPRHVVRVAVRGGDRVDHVVRLTRVEQANQDVVVVADGFRCARHAGRLRQVVDHVVEQLAAVG